MEFSRHFYFKKYVQKDSGSSSKLVVLLETNRQQKV